MTTGSLLVASITANLLKYGFQVTSGQIKQRNGFSMCDLNVEQINANTKYFICLLGVRKKAITGNTFSKGLLAPFFSILSGVVTLRKWQVSKIAL